jgi:hypothetical protein
LRTQCIARDAGARLESPKKPYLIKSLLTDGWGGLDGDLGVSDKPIWLECDERALAIARAITCGRATTILPVIYVSATGEQRWNFTRREIEKLAYDLGGVAHVVVEPNRPFSFQLRDVTGGENVYGGTVGLSVPGRGVVRRLYLGWHLQDSADLGKALRAAALNLRSQMPSEGWDWTELQEQALRLQRERDRNRLSAQENEQLYQEEIENLQDRVSELEQQLKSRAETEVAVDGGEDSVGALVSRVGPEIYPGEFFDRLRFAAEIAISVSERLKVDRRSQSFFKNFLEKIPFSPARKELLEDLERATKNPKRAAAEISSLLLRHGYQEKADKRHIRLEGKSEYEGLDTVTVSKTPSDKRALMNTRKQIERALGISKLSGKS